MNVARSILEKVPASMGCTLVVVLVALLPYASALGHAFVWDDVANIVHNPWLWNPAGWWSAFTRPASGFDPQFAASYYRPVLHLANRATYAIAGPEPRAFHAVNLGLHALASALVFWTCRNALVRFAAPASATPWAALAAGLVFAVHPVHVEAVAWLAGITDLTFAVFGLACILSYLTARTRLDFALAGAWLLLALLSKEPAATIPGILLAIELLPGGRPAPGLLGRFWPVAAAFAIYLALRWNALGGLAPHDNRAGVEAGAAVLVGFDLFASYLRYLVVAHPLSALHPFDPPTSALDPLAWLAIGMCAAFVVAFVWARRSTFVRLALLWIALPLLPVLWVPALGEGVFAERYLYFPSAGFALLVGWAAARALESDRKVLVGAVGALSVVLAVGGVAAWQRTAVWRDSLTLWSDTAARSPESAAAQEYLCAALYDAGRFAEAAGRCRESLRLDDSRVDARINLGNALAVLGDLDGALASLDAALRLRPGSVEAWTTRGLVRMAQGAPDDALASYRRALDIDPNNAEAHNVLGVALARLGRPNDARHELAEAVRLAPDREEYRRNLDSLGGPP